MLRPFGLLSNGIDIFTKWSLDASITLALILRVECERADELNASISRKRYESEVHVSKVTINDQ